MNESANHPGSSPPRLLIIRNPTAGRARRRGFFRDVEAALRRAGCHVETRETAGPGAAEDMARAACRSAYDAIVVAGGDGTINEAVNGLVGGGVPLGIIPMGTANVLAAELGLPADAAGIAQVIVSGVAAPAYLGLVNGRHFIQMAGVGFDAYVVSRVGARTKRLLGKGAYVLESIRALWGFGFPRYRLTIDGTVYMAASAVIAKGHYYGGRFTCAPDARLDDPTLHVCLFEAQGPWNALRYAAGLALGRLHRMADTRIVVSTFIVVEGPAGDPIQGDGEILNVLPSIVSVAATTFPVLRPPGYSPDRRWTKSGKPVSR